MKKLTILINRGAVNKIVHAIPKGSKINMSAMDANKLIDKPREKN